MRQRKSFTPEKKVSILREYLLDNVPVSDLCDKYGLNPNVFYRWQKEMFEKSPKFIAAVTNTEANRMPPRIIRTRPR